MHRQWLARADPSMSTHPLETAIQYPVSLTLVFRAMGDMVRFRRKGFRDMYCFFLDLISFDVTAVNSKV